MPGFSPSSWSRRLHYTADQDVAFILVGVAACRSQRVRLSGIGCRYGYVGAALRLHPRSDARNRSEGIASMQIVRPALSAYPRLCMGMLIVKEKHYVRR